MSGGWVVVVVVNEESLAYTPGEKSIGQGAGKVSLRVAVCSEEAAPPTAQASTSDRKPACDPALQLWVDCADDLFHGDGRLYGFIVTNNNSYTETYGFEHLYEPISEKPDISQIEVIKRLKGKKERLIAYEYGFIREKNIYEWFADLVNRQNNTGVRLTNPEGKKIIALNGRFCNRKGRRSVQVQKVFKSGIGEIKDCILLTLTTHQKEVQQFMPENSN